MSGLTLLIFTGVILVAGIIVVFGLVSILSKGQEVQERMHIYADVPDIQTPQATGTLGLWLNRTRVRMNILLSGFASEELSLQLARANWMISVTEFFLIRIGLTFVAFLSGWAATRFVVSGVALAVVVYLIPGVILSRSVGKRQLQFGKQLLDVLVLMNGAVRAGFSMLQSLEFVVKEMTPPASDEFRRVLREVSLGLTISQALTNLAQRMENKDLELVVTSVNIQYQVGGNLATMLSAITETIRDRIRLFQEVRVLTTQARYTSYLITLMPVAIGALFFMINPGYMMGIFTGGYLCIPIGAVIGIILGHFVIRRMVNSIEL